MDILLLRGFNNYFNRIVKKYTTLADYKTNSASFLEFTGINFNPNDGVVTELILGSPAQQESSAPLAWDQLGTPDYLICSETVNSTTTIKFRWFVLESERTRDGQYRLALKRDVLADHFNEILDAPCFIEKGYINDISDPLILNTENTSTNQIKQDETPLIDESNCAWLVGYIKKNLGERHESGTMVKDLENAYDFDDLYFKDAIESDDSLISATDTLIVPSGMTLKWMGFSDGWPTDAYYGYTGTFISNNNVSWSNVGNQASASWELLNSALITFPGQSVTGGITATQIATRMSDYSNSIPSATRNSFRTYITSNIKTAQGVKEVSDLGTTDSYSQFIAKYNGALVIKDNIAYRLNIYVDSNTSSAYGLYNYNSNSSIGAYFDYYISDLASYSGKSFSRNNDSPTGQKLRGDLSYRRIVVSAIKQDTTGAAYTITIPQSASRIVTDDALYDVFAVPYIPTQYSSEKTATFIDPDGTSHNINSEAMLFITQLLMTKLNMGQTNAEAYDLQVLPYCPIQMPNNNDLRNLDEKSYSLITQESGGTNVTVGYVIFAPLANFSKNIVISKPISSLTPINFKIKNETEFMRLTSPNFNGMFEFKNTKLQNGLHYVNIDCTYKPYNPYIKLNPDFSGFYGDDWNDSTGLICGGDFSVPVLNDAWTNYQLNNKNYQAIFNRQIQNLDIGNQIAQEQLTLQNATGILGGTLGGGVSGALTGAKAGPWGAVAGAVLGTAGGAALSGYGAIKNKEWLNTQQGEARSYAIDMYNYQLGNIKALPQTISKSDPLTYNNKIWPILEEFGCTPKERDILTNKLTYDGMTIMAIGRLGDYSISTELDKVYVKGQLIRVDNIADDFHMIDAIYQEVNKGFYIPQ